MSYKLLLSSTLILLLTACGSGDNNTLSPGASTDNSPDDITPSSPEETVYTGVFLDSAVQGLHYTTATQSGTTNEQGEFDFQTDETITFSIGGITLPPTPAKLYLTPLSLYQTDDINQLEVVNLIRLLQTLDLDGDASNGIEITEQAHQLATNLNIDFSGDDFDQQVADFINQAGSAHQTLLANDEAIAHFQLTLNDINNKELNSCTSTHEKIGYSGFFNTISHNVSGKATIIDDCTIEISQFSYDGGGPLVYFYGATDHEYAGDNAFRLGNLLTGTIFNDATISITLPQGKSLDDLTGLSVWCVDFNANFGQMEFTP
ncbi:DM13 domain-containing protein [Colwellia echini]|nr:DM13 domain-containing protein [Colwellia echini]